MSAAAEPREAAVELLKIAHAFDYPRPEFWEQADPGRTRSEREADYQGAFDVDGASLYEGFHRGSEGREGILEDLMRFYAFFDLRLSETERDYPDHLVTELEFLSFLAVNEADAKAEGKDARPFQLAQRDFISRHLGIWLPALAHKLQSAACESSNYPGLASALQKSIEVRRRELEKEIEGGKS
jgi:DMSO reductase family type II enzyme chaperone